MTQKHYMIYQCTWEELEHVLREIVRESGEFYFIIEVNK